MAIRTFYSCILVLWVLSPSAYAQEATLAFPGAEGFGKFTKGGRGGQVIEVTNLNDGGPGSFRAAVEASGPRTVVFRVGGTILLDPSKKPPRISDPFITIAGQTAPGGGITVRGGMLDIRASEVIVRYMRFRPGPTVYDPESGDAMQMFSYLNPVHNVIIDHVSMSWTTDEVFMIWASPYKVHGITVQWSLLYESLHCSTHPEGCHGKGPLFGGSSQDGLELSMHHNLLAHHVDRNPLVSNGHVDIVNNIIYNYGSQGTTLQPWQGVVLVNMIRNYYLPGPDSTSNPPIRLMGDDAGRQPYAPDSRVYLEENIHPVYAPTGTEDQTRLLKIPTDHGGFPTTQTRFPYPSISTTDAFQAKTAVLAKAGATLPSRDTVDTRIVNHVTNGTGGIIDKPSDVGGWLSVASGTPTKDTDHDGMPDSWELAWGLNPTNGEDGSQDVDGDGYTNLEEYLNGRESGEDSLPPAAPQNVTILVDEVNS